MSNAELIEFLEDIRELIQEPSYWYTDYAIRKINKKVVEIREQAPSVMS